MMREAGRARQRPSTVLCTGRAWVPKSYHAGMHANFINWAAGWGGGMGMGVGVSRQEVGVVLQLRYPYQK